MPAVQNDVRAMLPFLRASVVPPLSMLVSPRVSKRKPIKRKPLPMGAPKGPTPPRRPTRSIEPVPISDIQEALDAIWKRFKK